MSRDPDETVPILLKMRAALFAHLSAERLRPLGYTDRARFIREAIAEKLGLDKELALMKSRENVGGSPSHRVKAKARYVITPQPAHQFNDRPANSPAAQAAVDKLDADTLRPLRKSRRP